jgi:hypothetical protein
MCVFNQVYVDELVAYRTVLKETTEFLVVVVTRRCEEKEKKNEKTTTKKKKSKIDYINTRTSSDGKE